MPRAVVSKKVELQRQRGKRRALWEHRRQPPHVHIRYVHMIEEQMAERSALSERRRQGPLAKVDRDVRAVKREAGERRTSWEGCRQRTRTLPIVVLRAADFQVGEPLAQREHRRQPRHVLSVLLRLRLGTIRAPFRRISAPFGCVIELEAGECFVLRQHLHYRTKAVPAISAVQTDDPHRLLHRKHLGSALGFQLIVVGVPPAICATVRRRAYRYHGSRLEVSELPTDAARRNPISPQNHLD